MSARDLALPFEPPPRAVRIPAATLVMVGLVAIVGWLVVPPLAILIYGSVTDTPPGVAPHFTLDNLYDAYGRGRIWLALWRSFLYAASTATLVLVIGGFLAWLVERTDSRLRSFVDLF